MQTFLSSLIVLIAALYIAKRWLPHQLKQRLLQLFGKNLAAQQSNGACGSCSSCGSCGSSEGKNLAEATKKVMFTHRK